MMDNLNSFTSDEYLTYATQGEDYGCRATCPSIKAIGKDYTKRHGKGNASMNGYN